LWKDIRLNYVVSTFSLNLALSQYKLIGLLILEYKQST